MSPIPGELYLIDLGMVGKDSDKGCSNVGQLGEDKPSKAVARRGTGLPTRGDRWDFHSRTHGSGDPSHRSPPGSDSWIPSFRLSPGSIQ